MDISCEATISAIHLIAKSCSSQDAASCSEDEDMKDISEGSSIKYKPDKEALSWPYHGLFVKGKCVGNLTLSQSQVVHLGF